MRGFFLRAVQTGLFLAGMNVSSAPAQTPAPPANIAHPAFPNGSDTPLAQQIASILSGPLADPAMARAHWGIAVLALDGTPIYGLDERQFFRPASNAKLYTTAAALALLGPKAVVNTVVQSARPDEKGVVHGDIRLVGDGDANLSGTVFPYVPPAGEPGPAPNPMKVIDELAAQVAATGVRRVTGDVVGDGTRWPWEPYPQSWAIDDMVWDFGAPVSSLVLNDSTITVTLRAGAKVGDPATVTQMPDVGLYTLVARIDTVDAKGAKKIDVERAVGSHTLTITGQLPIGTQDIEQIAAADPLVFAAMALRSSLIEHGVRVDGRTHGETRPSSIRDSFSKQAHDPVTSLPRQVLSIENEYPCVDACLETLAAHTSPALAQDVMLTLKVSQNLHAEMLQRRLGKAYGNEASAAQGARVVRQWLTNAGIDGNDFVFFDGSGLSDHDLVTPRATAQLLSFATTQPWFAQWKAALPIGGVDGSLAGRFKDPPLKGHVFAKTGTLGESRALSGYLDCASGKQVIFSIMVDNHAPGALDRAAMDRIVAAIAANN